MESDKLLLAILGVLGVIVVVSMLAPFGGYGMMGFYGGGMLLSMTLVWVLVIIALVLFIAWLMKQLSENNGGKKHGHTKE